MRGLRAHVAAVAGHASAHALGGTALGGTALGGIVLRHREAQRGALPRGDAPHVVWARCAVVRVTGDHAEWRHAAAPRVFLIPPRAYACARQRRGRGGGGGLRGVPQPRERVRVRVPRVQRGGCVRVQRRHWGENARGENTPNACPGRALPTEAQEVVHPPDDTHERADGERVGHVHVPRDVVRGGGALCGAEDGGGLCARGPLGQRGVMQPPPLPCAHSVCVRLEQRHVDGGEPA
eukprot:2782613-Rhodomonas_salina.1